jgi:hypothetical protein
MAYRIAGVDVHKKMLAVAVADVAAPILMEPISTAVVISGNYQQAEARGLPAPLPFDESTVRVLWPRGYFPKRSPDRP